MNVGFVGLGKLGLPVALAIEAAGHTVAGVDLNPAVAGYIEARSVPYLEAGIGPLLDTTAITVLPDVAAVVAWADLVFLPVQTPHEPRFEGDTPLPDDRADFDYTWLTAAVADVCETAAATERPTTLVVISTCLPGTYTREIEPLLNRWVTYLYNPFFIAMGTVIDDFRNPEFVLVGGDNTRPLDDLYVTIHDAPTLRTDITTAEAIKVAYNTFITAKTVLANTWGQLCERLGANVDDVTLAWTMSTNRLLSPKYLNAGMSDGGHCHPRDSIALSHVARREGMSFDFFEALMLSRQSHEEWLAAVVADEHAKTGLPVVVLGRTFKPGTNLTGGSPATLLAHYLTGNGVTFAQWDGHVDESPAPADGPHLYFVATAHPEYARFPFGAGSVVVDPHGIIADRDGVRVRRLGRQ